METDSHKVIKEFPFTIEVPNWSLDSKTMAYCAFRPDENGVMERDVWTMPAKGGKETRLTTAPGLDDGPEYSPDGKSVVFICYHDYVLSRVRQMGYHHDGLPHHQYQA